MATKRGYYREELKRAQDNLEMCLTHISRVIDAYKDDHPDIADHALQVGDMIVYLIQAIETIRQEI